MNIFLCFTDKLSFKNICNITGKDFCKKFKKKKKKKWVRIGDARLLVGGEHGESGQRLFGAYFSTHIVHSPPAKLYPLRSLAGPPTTISAPITI